MAVTQSSDLRAHTPNHCPGFCHLNVKCSPSDLQRGRLGPGTCSVSLELVAKPGLGPAFPHPLSPLLAFLSTLRITWAKGESGGARSSSSGSMRRGFLPGSVQPGCR